MNRSGSLIGISAGSTKVPDSGAWGTLRWLSSQLSDSGALLHQTVRSAARNGTHRVDADHDRRPRVERQLVADLAGPQQVAEERAFARREADVDPARIELDRVTSSSPPSMPKRRRSSCIGTYGRLLMKRRSWGAVHWPLRSGFAWSPDPGPGPAGCPSARARDHAAVGAVLWRGASRSRCAAGRIMPTSRRWAHQRCSWAIRAPTGFARAPGVGAPFAGSAPA